MIAKWDRIDTVIVLILLVFLVLLGTGCQTNTGPAPVYDGLCPETGLLEYDLPLDVSGVWGITCSVGTPLYCQAVTVYYDDVYAVHATVACQPLGPVVLRGLP